jgi:hypothetical protein
VVDRLHPGRIVRELRAPEVGLARAGGDDQAVVGYPATATDGFDSETASVEIDGNHLAEHHRRVLLVAEHVPDGRGDIALREDPRRQLIEQRLEHVVVLAVDERQVDGCPRQRSGCCETGEAAPDDHDVGARGH